MMRKRDFLIAGACVAAAGAGHVLRPSRNISLLGDKQLADVVPVKFGTWQSQDVGDPLALNSDALLGALYNQLLVRLYTDEAAGEQVMMLMAYGARQTDQLQLHRPEVCYPAFGYTLVSNEAVQLPVGANVTVPSRRLRAESEERSESVLYWSRMGEYLPVDGGEQRKNRFMITARGIIPDGLLSRFSCTPVDPARPWLQAERFIPALLQAVEPQYRKALIGTDRAARLVGGAQPL